MIEQSPCFAAEIQEPVLGETSRERVIPHEGVHLHGRKGPLELSISELATVSREVPAPLSGCNCLISGNRRSLSPCP